MNALNVLNLLPDSFESLETFIFQLENEIYEEGNVDAYMVLAKLKLFEKLSEKIIKSPRFKENVSSSLDDKENDFGKFIITESYRDSFNFSSNETYAKLKEKEDAIKKDLKQISDFLKTVPEEGFVNEDTGEIIEPPEKIKSTKVISVTWKKPSKKKEQDNNHLDNIFNK